MSEERLEKHPMRRVLNVLAWRYSAQYGVNIRIVLTMQPEHLARMTPDARAVMFSSRRWETDKRPVRKKPVQRAFVPEQTGRVDDLMALASKTRCA
ncbi:MAG: hypothetical protein P4L40_21560 [Terracidiphilus sp.]|nr:hypothetical protein [Terracidiphilus sp.]